MRIFACTKLAMEAAKKHEETVVPIEQRHKLAKGELEVARQRVIAAQAPLLRQREESIKEMRSLIARLWVQS
jgi:hypothetical protein